MNRPLLREAMLNSPFPQGAILELPLQGFCAAEASLPRQLGGMASRLPWLSLAGEPRLCARLVL